MNIKSITRILPLTIVVIVLILITHFYISLFLPPGQGAPPVIVEFGPGAGFRHVAKALKEKGLIRDVRGFTLLAKIRRSTKSIQAGEYEFNDSMSPSSILERMEKGLVLKHPVTIPEGYNIRDIADLLEKKGLSRRERFLEKATDKKFLTAIGIEGPSAEGYLFPETYQFPKGLSEEAMIKHMFARFKEVVSDEMKTRAKARGLSLHEVVILASVVEKETGDPSERPMIARVFFNRLVRGIMLQSDPTTIYGIPNFNGNITRKDLLTYTPYNTYRITGLPVGPISNPGLASIKAVLCPDEGQFLYFVSKNDGTHYFSKTLSEHNKAVYEYQIASRRRNKH